MTDCIHKIRDNKYGVTWCVRCGRLFNKSSGKELKEWDKIHYVFIPKRLE